MNPRRIKNILLDLAAVSFFVGVLIKPRPVETWRTYRAKKRAAKASEQEKRRHEHRGRGERY